MRSSGSSARSCTAACGETSRPSVNAWIQCVAILARAKLEQRRRWSMCEWTPPCETRPSRWTSPPRSRARGRRRAPRSRRTSRPRSPCSRASDPGRARGPSRSSGGRPRSCPSGPAGARLPRPEPRASCAGTRAQSRSKTGVSASSTALPGPGRRAAPAVQDHERYERERCRRAQIAANDSTSSEAPPTSAPSTSGCAAAPRRSRA